MSVLARRMAPPAERRDVMNAPWIDGRSVPSAFQEASSGYAYRTADVFKVAAAVACIGLRSGAFVQMPLKGYTTVDGHSELLNPQPEILRSPSRVVRPSIWKAQLSISRDVWGYAAGIIMAVDGAGYPAQVEWVIPDRIRGRAVKLGEPIEWRVDGQVWDSERIFHIPSRWVTADNPVGMSPLEQSGLVDLSKKVQDFGRDWFARGAVPSAILYSDQVLTTDEADRLLSKITARWRRRQPGVLGSGLKYEQVAVPANESQFLETATKAAADVANSFNMPPSKIGAAIAGQSITYANRDQDNEQYLIDSINPDLVVIQEYIEWHMRGDTFPRFNSGALLRSDIKTRYEIGALGVKAGLITRDEWRATEDLPPMTADQLASLPPASPTITIGGAQ